MKALIITNHLGSESGWSRYSADLAAHLIKNGIEVIVICHRKNDAYNIKQIEILPPPLSYKKNYILGILYALKIIKQVHLINDISFIHCLVEPYAFISFLVAKFLKLKYFITLHGSYAIKLFYNRLYKTLQLLSYKNAVKVITISHYTKKRLLEYKKLNNIIVIPNGVDISLFSKKIDISTKENIIVGVGALKKRKGFDKVIKALSIVKTRFSNIKYYIIGSQKDVAYFDYLKNFVDSLELNDNIFFLSNISDNRLKKIYQQAKIFILTPVSSQYNFEGFGLVYLEANACGLPVIGAYNCGAEDAIKNNYNGFLVNSNNPREIAEKIIKIFSDNDLYQKISRNVIDWTKKFSWDKTVDLYIKEYNKILK